MNHHEEIPQSCKEIPCSLSVTRLNGYIAMWLSRRSLQAVYASDVYRNKVDAQEAAQNYLLTEAGMDLVEDAFDCPDLICYCRRFQPKPRP